MNAPQKRLRGKLFIRIYLTFVVSVVLFAGVAGLLVWAWFSSWDEARIAETIDRVEDEGERLEAAMRDKDREAIHAILADLERDLDAAVVVFPRDHRRKPQFGPPLGVATHEHDRPNVEPMLRHLSRAEFRQLRRGRPLVRRHGLRPPMIGVPIFTTRVDQVADKRPERLIAVVAVVPHHNPQRIVVVGGILLLLALAGGAWPLAHSLTSRLGALERSTRALADGELSHRATIVEDGPRDEIHGLALAFNQMADRLETLLNGQRTLLANVSHELRTPIARIKVLVEILGERLERLQDAQANDEAIATEALDRLTRGLGEMQDDLEEVEALIRDLLTSGRLELGRDGALQRETIDVAELCERAASRFDAQVEAGAGLTLEGDRLLLDRLLNNLLANARRACPAGALTIRAARTEDGLTVEVEDEGPGIPADRRQQIFEPFARLDSARARDQGGVGLGLYLCRQIVAAHGGTIRAADRRDGRPGARFVIMI